MGVISGNKTSFWLDATNESPNNLTDISAYLDTIDGSSDTEELDGTTFQPEVAVPIKNIVAGFSQKGFSLSGKWSAEAEAFFAAVETLSGLHYQYGPEGTAVGKTKITGLCNVLSYSGPQSSVGGITTFSVELRVSSREVGTF